MHAIRISLPAGLMVVAALAFSGLAQERESEAEFDPQAYTSPLGHTFVHVQTDPEATNEVALDVVWRHGWVEEGRSPAVPYVATESMLAGGLADDSPLTIQEIWADLGAGAWVDPGIEFVQGALVAPLESIDEAVAIASQVLLRPEIGPDWIHDIADSMAEAQAVALTDPRYMLVAGMHLAATGDTPAFRFATTPEPEAFATVNAESVGAWHEDTFGQDPVHVAVAGPIGPGRAGELVDALLGPNEGIADPGSNGRGEELPAPPARTIVWNVPGLDRAFIGLFGPLPDPHGQHAHVDKIALDALRDGPLFRTVRSDLGAAYSVDAGTTTYGDDGQYLQLLAEVNPSLIEGVAAGMEQAYDEFRQSPDRELLQDGLDDFRNYNKDFLTDPLLLATTINLLRLEDNSRSDLESIVAETRSTELQEIDARIQRDFPQAAGLTILVVAPPRTDLEDACRVKALRDIPDC